jgi:predicted dithiol-disulfide oxidoreductase (DUF899 family)
MYLNHPPQATAGYRKLREELHEAERALRDQRERVAALRRELPADTPFDDAVFEVIRDGERHPVRLSELFEQPERPLVLMHFMYGKQQTRPCPMCTAWADGYDGVLPHLTRRVNFAVLVAGDVGAFEAYARGRGWRNLRAVSAADSDVKRVLGFETEDGAQEPGVSVFTRDAGGGVCHFYSGAAPMGGGEFRGMDLLSPIWHFFDLTPEGRGDFFPSKSYGD